MPQYSISTDGDRRRNLHRFCMLMASITAVIAGASADIAAAADASRRPNVVLIMTDDQGYGDLRCLGNEVIETPALDRLHAESVRLTDYHVDPTCSPTRSALMTGRYSSRTGVWHTIMGRSLMHADETTVAQIFTADGYRTGCFGKWHLGDNYPLRPQDRGFQEVLIHGGGGITQTPDFWDNDYFDDTYWHNGRPEQQTGYCTDVFFDAAAAFIESSRKTPFFCYIASNAPHGPYLVADRYSGPYRKLGIPDTRAAFYGMISNIDENVGRLRTKLQQLDLEENTVLIFTTDNGTAAGIDRQGGFNAGMRGTKGSEYDGGHRVPCFIRWPRGNIGGGRDVGTLTAHIDLLPTLAELCGLEIPKMLDLDGKSLVPLLVDKQPSASGNGESSGWPPRTLFVHSQRIEHPEPWRKCAVMTDRWRLVNGTELYDMRNDPGQNENVAQKYPDLYARLRTQYETWYAHISARFDDYVHLVVGAARQNPTTLTCHDWHADISQVPWSQGQVRRDPPANGFWMIEAARAGRYRVTLRSRPEGVPYKMRAGTARVQVGDVRATAPVNEGADSTTVTMELPAGKNRVQTWLDSADGSSRGAYFVTFEYVE